MKLTYNALSVVTAIALTTPAWATDPQDRELNAASLAVTPVESDYEIRTARNHFFKRVITSTKPQTTGSKVFVPLKGAATKIVVPPRSRVLVNVSFDAESRCSDIGGNSAGWCEARILINGAEGAPAASVFTPDTFALDSTDNGTEGNGSWEGHSMTRHKCIINRSDKPLRVPVEFEWKLTNFGAGSPNPQFWLDDWSLVVEMADGCWVRRVVE